MIKWCHHIKSHHLAWIESTNILNNICFIIPIFIEYFHKTLSSISFSNIRLKWITIKLNWFPKTTYFLNNNLTYERS